MPKKEEKLYFHQNLQYLIEEQGISQRELAKKVNIASATLDSWVGTDGRSPSDLLAVRRIAKHFGVSLEKLLYENIQEPAFLDEHEEYEAGETVLDGLFQVVLRRVKRKAKTRSAD